MRRRSLLAGAAWPILAGAAAPMPAATAAAQPSRTVAPTVFNARDFGARGDASHDDTAALQAALDAAAAADRGGTVVVPHGVYRTRTLSIGSRVHLTGAGIEATILRLADGVHDDLVRTRDVARLSGTNAVAGPFNWSIRDLTLDGNRARNSAGCGLRAYGWGYLLRDLRIRQCAGAGVSSEWSTEDPVWSEGGFDTPGDSMEAQVVNLKVHHCGAGGVIWRGPHDAQFVNLVVYDTKTVGVHLASGPKFSATGCQLVNSHVWGGHQYGYRIEAGYVNLVNCVAEWAGAAQVLVVDSDATLVACRFFGDPKRPQVGIEIGAKDQPVYGTQIDARMADLAGGALKFTNEGGSGQIRALVYQKSGVPYTGRPARGTRFEFQVNGLEHDEASTTWIARGSLGWNGGTPIVRHLSGTSEWSPPRLAPGGAGTHDVTVPGATIGDTVAVGFSRPVPGGAVLAGSVTADDTVTVTLLNATGRALALARGVLRADCWVH